MLDETPSLAVNRKVYAPPNENVAVVFVTFALPNVTVPGPLNFDHEVVSVPLGSPSSLAVPFRLAADGSVID